MHTQRTYVPFQSIWKMGIDHPYSLWVADGAVAWSCGQCPIDSNGAIIAPWDLVAQRRFVAGLIKRTLETGAIAPTHVCKLIVYYVPEADANASGMIDEMRSQFGSNVVVVPVAVPHFYYEGMLIEVDVFASTNRPRYWTAEDEHGRVWVQFVDSGELIHAKVTCDALGGGWETVRAWLEKGMQLSGLSREHWLADYWFVSSDEASGLLHGAAKDGFCSDPGAAALCDWGDETRVVADIIFVPGGGAVADLVLESEGLRFRRRGRFFHISARRAEPTSLIQQTAGNMGAVRRALRAEGLGFDNVSKATTLYAGGSKPAELHDNMSVRNSHYEQPGPASTGLPVLRFPFSSSLITVDVIGTVPMS